VGPDEMMNMVSVSKKKTRKMVNATPHIEWNGDDRGRGLPRTSKNKDLSAVVTGLHKEDSNRQGRRSEETFLMKVKKNRKRGPAKSRRSAFR
jgi:hypothetical protein